MSPASVCHHLAHTSSHNLISTTATTTSATRDQKKKKQQQQQQHNIPQIEAFLHVVTSRHQPIDDTKCMHLNNKLNNNKQTTTNKQQTNFDR
jgi:hypothetical protein